MRHPTEWTGGEINDLVARLDALAKDAPDPLAEVLTDASNIIGFYHAKMVQVRFAAGCAVVERKD